MQEEKRVVLVSILPEKMLKILDQPFLCVCGVVSHGAQLLSLLTSLQPHAVVFADCLPDLPEILKQISLIAPIAPPRIIVREDVHCPADAVFDTAMPQQLPSLIVSACVSPLGILALPSFEKRYALSQSLLTQLGMPRLLGRESIALGAAWLSAAPLPVSPAKQWLYPQLAQHQHTTPAAIERRIRSAIESTWLHGNLSAQSELFGFTVSAERGKPTNAEFLFLLSEHIRSRLI